MMYTHMLPTGRAGVDYRWPQQMTAFLPSLLPCSVTIAVVAELIEEAGP